MRCYLRGPSRDTTKRGHNSVKWLREHNSVFFSRLVTKWFCEAEFEEWEWCEAVNLKSHVFRKYFCRPDPATCTSRSYAGFYDTLFCNLLSASTSRSYAGFWGPFLKMRLLTTFSITWYLFAFFSKKHQLEHLHHRSTNKMGLRNTQKTRLVGLLLHGI